MPDGAVVVSRPSRWGNPFSVEEHGRELAVTLFSEVMRGVWDPSILDHLSDDDYRSVAYARESFMRRIGYHPQEAARSELRGKDLACWCAHDQPCHADVLLEVANA
jgi:hypothetical protein